MKMYTSSNSMTSQALLLVMMSCIVLMMTSQTLAWSQWVDDDNNWSGSDCAKTDEFCTRTGRCCHPNDICLKSAKRNGHGFCTRMDTLGMIGGGKAEREPCTASFQCADGCCREYRQHRVGKVYMCGTPQDRFTTFRCA